ncbi:MAG TPA: cytochrome c biogenesis protein CcdA [Thermoanaerobaculaceae bacterium]|nr:cytochrome c biogenesis protein CcdA [Thermoanaerobaculaceae bacterium]HRS16481.1 cytochrome c biogenesis protein CcdA [Thermoanaerobaculaceae bacterium]
MRRLVVAAVLGFGLAAWGVEAAQAVFSAAPRWERDPAGPPAAFTLVVTVTVDEGWHVNSHTPLSEDLIPTTLRLDLPAGWSAGEPVFPKHRAARFAFSDEPVAVYEGTFAIRVPVTIPAETDTAPVLGVAVAAQACNDRECLPPTEVTATIAHPALAGFTAAAPPPVGTPAPASHGGVGGRFAAAGLWLQLLLALVAGLALNLTPCVYPLIPITISFFLSQKQQGAGAAWPLAVAYVLGMSVTYSALGVAAALGGALFGAALQSPWVVGVIVAVMLALAASMFGLWELRVPAFVMNLSGGRAGLGGSLVMGLVVGLVAAPCIGPFVLGLLTYVGQRQDLLLGFLLFFALSLGLGLPYLLLAVSTGALDRLPNSGAWMLGVRKLFGVLLIGLAAYFSAPLLPAPWAGWLLALSLGLGGLYLLVIARPGHEMPAIDRFMRLASAGLIVAGLLLAPASRPSESTGPAWQPYDEAAVAAAVAAGRPVVLDFYADWCLPCKELDKLTFSDPRVTARLGAMALHKVDLTRSNADTDALRAKYAVAGVPTIVFYRGGQEVAGARLTGFENADAFLRRLDRVEGVR